MCRLTLKAIVWIVAAIIAIANPIQAIGQDDSYVNQCQTGGRPLKLSRIAGIAKAEDGAVVVGVRVLLFTDPDHKLIASTVTDYDGLFAFGHIKRGSYWLIAKTPGFTPANASIVVRRFGKKQLHFHMITGGLDACSYGDVK